MISWPKAAFEAYLQLQSELQWLKDNHPDKTALIALAENNIKTIKQASGDIQGYSISENPFRNHLYGAKIIDNKNLPMITDYYNRGN